MSLFRPAALLTRFAADERGVFAVMFGLIAVVLITLAGSVVDYTAMQQARTRTQQALDAAALGLQPTIFEDDVTPASLKRRVQAVLRERLATTSNFTVKTPTIEADTGLLHLEADVTIPTAFVRLIGFPSLEFNIVSEARRRQLNLEIAMVLDNSGSMGSYSRIQNLRSAAKCATNVLLNGDCNSTASTTSTSKVWIGIVPFTMFVKVGSGYRTASWMDSAGQSAVSRANFDDDNDDSTTFGGDVDRFALYDHIGASWDGCIEARARTRDSSGLYYDTSDSPPDVLNPNSLFVPEFAPDQPSGYPNNYLDDEPNACPSAPRYTKRETITECRRSSDRSSEHGDNCRGSTTTSYEQTVNGVTTAASRNRPSSLGGNSGYQDTGYYTSYRASNRGSYKYTHESVESWIYPYSDRELQERQCKYTRNSARYSNGPNQNCTGTTILPLTATKSSITSKINAMVADGGTNIQQGVMWGFHMLSPSEPLTEAGPYESSRSKAMIVMTDGENYHSYDNDFTGAYYYTANGYPYTGRLTGNSTNALIAAMNARTLETCTNAKDAGITIYTVGLNPPNQDTIDMLTACASGPDKAHFPTQSSELNSVFENIANQLSNLRLSK